MMVSSRVILYQKQSVIKDIYQISQENNSFSITKEEQEAPRHRKPKVQPKGTTLNDVIQSTVENEQRSLIFDENLVALVMSLKKLLRKDCKVTDSNRRYNRLQDGRLEGRTMMTFKP